MKEKDFEKVRGNESHLRNPWRLSAAAKYTGRGYYAAFCRLVAILLSAALLMVSLPIEAWAGVTMPDDHSTMKVTNLGYRPGGILTADDGSIFVKNCDTSSAYHGQVYKYNQSGELVKSFGSQGHTTFDTEDRGVGLSYASDGDIVTTFYDGKIYKFNSETGAQTAFTEVDGIPYCSILYDGYIYVIVKNRADRHILVLDNSLKTVSDTSLGVNPDSGTIPVENGYYGLAIAKTTDSDGKTVERLYTTQFGEYVYGYIKQGNDWFKDSSFGANGRLASCEDSAGGLFYNEKDQKVYVCSELDEKVYNFNPDGTNLNTVLNGKGPNNVYISDSSYAVPYYSGQAFQVFYRPSIELNKDNFSMQLLNTVQAGTRDRLDIKVQNTNLSTARSYQVTAQLLDDSGAPIDAVCTTGTLIGGGVKLSITPKRGWIAGQYQIQLLISSRIMGTNLTISETMKLDAQVPVSMYMVTFQKPVNGSLENQDAIYAKQAGAGVGSSVTKWVQPADSYEVDVNNCQILPEGSGAQVTVGAVQKRTVNGVEGDWYPLSVSNITSDIQVTVAFKMNAAALQAKKQQALNALDEAYQGYDAGNYFGDNWEKLTNVKTDYAQRIQNAASAEEVDMLLAGAQEEMIKIPDMARDSERQELVKAAKAAIEEEFNAKYGAPGKKDEYSQDNWSKLLQAKEAAITAIGEAKDENGINSAQQKGLSDMAGIPTIAQEELNTKKDEAKSALSQVAAGEDTYAPEQLAAIESKRQELMNQIDNAASPDEFADVADTFNSFVGTYLTKADQAAMVQAVTDEFNRLNDVEDKYSAANLAALKGKRDLGISQIQGALLKSDAEIARNTAITEMGKVATQKDEQDAAFQEVEGTFKQAMKAYPASSYDSENWGKIQERYNQAVNEMEQKISKADMETVMNKALADIGAIETKEAALKTAKDTARTQVASSYKKVTDLADAYSQESLDTALQIYNDALTAIENAADKNGLAGVAEQAGTDFGKIQPISVALQGISINFETQKYDYAPVDPKTVVISASAMEGCDALNITGVTLSAASAFTLNGPESGTLEKGQENQEWSLTPKDGLTPGNYTADVTVSYDCQGKAASSITGTVSMEVINAEQETPTGLTPSHQKELGVNDGEIHGVTPEMEYREAAAQEYTPVPEDADGTVSGLAPGTYLFRMAAKDYYNPSSDSEPVIIKRVQPDVTASATPETGIGTKDGTITVESPQGELEYCKKGGSYQACDGTVEGLEAGIYYVRYAGTDTALVGKATEVEVECDAYAFSCSFNPALGNVTLSDGSELPGYISKSQNMVLKVTPNDGYMVEDNGITAASAKFVRETEEGHSFALTVSHPKGEVELSVKFTRTPERKKLDEKKEETKEKITQAIADEKKGYTDAQADQAGQLSDLQNQYMESVKNAATVDEVNSQYQEFQAALSKIHKDVMDEAIATASPSEAIKGDRQEEDYSKENWKKLDDLVTEAEKKLAAAQSPSDIDQIMADIKRQAANIPTKADEDKAALEKAKESALAGLATPSEAAPNPQEDYTPESWNDIIDLINQAKADIQDAGTKTAAAVGQILDNLNTAMDKVLTLDGERQKHIAELDTAYQSYDKNDYSDEIWNVLSGYHDLGTAKLENAATRPAMDQLLQEFKGKMADVKKDWELNPGSQKDPNTELVEYLIDLLPPKNASQEDLKDAQDAIQAAKEAYDNLNEKQAAQLDAGKIQKLEEQIRKLKDITVRIEDEDSLNVKANVAAGLLLDQMEIGSGTSVDVVLKVSLKEGELSERDAVAAILTQNQRIGSYLDITLEKTVDGYTEDVTELKRPMEIKFTIPKELRGYKNYQIIRIHDGAAEPLDTVQSGNTLKFTTDRFSTYVLTYETDYSQNQGHSGSSGGGSRMTAASKNHGAAPVQGSWVQNDAGWWFSKADGTWPASQWLYTGGGKWYYFNEDGYMVTGWIQLNHVWYYLKEDGEMAVGWIKLGDAWYYLKADGAMAVGWIQLGNQWYYLKADGAMAVGWIQLEDKWYYLKADGSMTVGWIQLGDQWYYLNADGSMAVGWVLSNGHWYYMDETGAMSQNAPAAPEDTGKGV